MLIRHFHIPEGETLEDICSKACYIAGSVFLVIALCGTWCHLFTTGVCMAAGFLIKEDERD